MGKEMLKNYNKTFEKPVGGLKDSVDFLRNSVRDLYELDEDNYQMIKNLQTALDKTNNRINELGRQLRKQRFRTAVGFLSIGGVFYLMAKAFDNSIDAIADETKNDPEEKHEESDG